uniref:ORC1/DEAH AAA+ ATPase domain-containing protein n=1 Tax=Leptobrachium leishanense TaxID=445787 RepID=A0A8C5N222_9ANUR
VPTLEEELLFALQDRPLDLLERCVCYIHKVPYKAILKQRAISQHDGEAGGYAKLCHIRDTLIPSLGWKMHVYSTTTTCDVKVGYTEEKEQQYVMGLCQQFYGDMLKLIQTRRPVRPASYRKHRMGEALQHLSHCNMFSDLQEYESKETENIKNYVLQDTSRRPLVVVGEPACGKTVLLASCAKKIRSWHEYSDPTLVIRFVSMFGYPPSLSRFLSGLCQQLADIYHRDIPVHLKSVHEIREFFADLLSESTKQAPVILILDAVDHLKVEENCQNFRWLPFPLPPYAKIILSLTRGINAESDLLLTSHEDHILLLEVKPLRKQCNESLKVSLMKRNRKVTSGQQVYVNRSLAANTSPLQMLLVFKEVMSWRSHHEVDEKSIGETLYETIENMFLKLELKYSYAVVSRALSYITLSRCGIAETELVDMLSADGVVLAQLYDLHDSVGTLRVPDWVVANIIFDLESCLSYRIDTGFQIVCWANGLYHSVVYNKYLSLSGMVNTLHENMGNYFSGRWACGRSKPIYLTQTQNPPVELPKSLSVDPNVQARIYVDCQLPSQPWNFTVKSGHHPFDIYNIRKASELPFHLMACGKLDILHNDVLMTLLYYKVLIKAGLLYSLIDSVDRAAELTDREEMYFIGNLLKEIKCVLQENPDSLEVTLQSKMASRLSTYPCLLKLIKQSYVEGFKSSSIDVLTTPLIDVQPTKVNLPESSSVVKILELKMKPWLVLVCGNGSVYSWELTKDLALIFKVPGLAQVRDVAVESEGRYLALYTNEHTFVILDCSSWVILQEIPCTSNDGTVLTLKNVHLSETSLFACFMNSPMYRMYDVKSGAVTEEIVFPEDITFFGCDSSGKYTIVGQKSNIIIFKNQNFSNKIDLCQGTLMLPIGRVHVLDSQVYVIDKVSNINVWDIDDPTEPRLVDELYTQEENNEVISSELTVEWLLICRSQSIDVWRTADWEKTSFRPPESSRFIWCVFSKSCEEIMAGAENGSVVFTWNRESGQCMSILHLEHGERTLFNQYLPVRSCVAVTTTSSLMLWDMNAVVTSTAFSQSGRPIKQLIYCPQRSAAYTADGSNMVCGWDILSGKITSMFSHVAPIELMTLMDSGELLVTSTMSGDLYVWLTETGENIHRIQGNNVSQLLTTPNTNLIASLCEHGVSRVWNPATGNIVCKIYVYLHQAVITPPGTFLVGLHNGTLLTVGLWAGSVGKRFPLLKQTSDIIVGFQCLKSTQDFLVVVTAGGDLYTWDVVEETICHQVKLPIDFSPLQRFFQVSANGKVTVLTVNKTVHVFCTQSGTLGVFHTPNTILHQHLSDDGNYFVYVCDGHQSSCKCSFHTNPTLNVMKVVNGEEVGHCYLGKTPTALATSDDDHTVCVGYSDGTLGLYSVADVKLRNTRTDKLSWILWFREHETSFHTWIGHRTVQTLTPLRLIFGIMCWRRLYAALRLSHHQYKILATN